MEVGGMQRRYVYQIIGDPSAAGGNAVKTSAAAVAEAGATVVTTPHAIAGGRTMGEGFAGRAIKGAATHAIISPLNQATGGLASPAFELGINIAKGAGAAAIGAGIAGLAIAGAMLAVRAIQDRVKKLEDEAHSLNERESLLVRAGAISQVSRFEANFFTGVQKVNRG
jgi:hypothetical protein